MWRPGHAAAITAASSKTLNSAAQNKAAGDSRTVPSRETERSESLFLSGRRRRSGAAQPQSLAKCRAERVGGELDRRPDRSASISLAAAWCRQLDTELCRRSTPGLCVPQLNQTFDSLHICV